MALSRRPVPCVAGLRLRAQRACPYRCVCCSSVERKKAWLELIGIFLFALPYCLVATWFAFWFAEISFMQNESSDAPNGLPLRWIIKFCLFLGLLMMSSAVLSVLSRRIVFLFGPPALAAKALPEPAAH